MFPNKSLMLVLARHQVKLVISGDVLQILMGVRFMFLVYS